MCARLRDELVEKFLPLPIGDITRHDELARIEVRVHIVGLRAAARAHLRADVAASCGAIIWDRTTSSKAAAITAAAGVRIKDVSAICIQTGAIVKYATATAAGINGTVGAESLIGKAREIIWDVHDPGVR